MSKQSIETSPQTRSPKDRLDELQQLRQRVAALESGMAAAPDLDAALEAARSEERRLRQRLEALAHEAEETRRQLAEAQAASRAKDQFLATLSHELRTPLSPIVNLIAVLTMRPDLPEDYRPILETMERNLWLEIRLVDELLDATRIMRDKMELSLQELDLHDLLHEVAEMLQDNFRQAEVRLDLALDAALSRIEADPSRIIQVFWNLLGNAAKFTPAGGRVSMRTLNPEPGQVKVLVEDTGAGIEPEQIDRLFEPFEQVRNARRGGLGLGLAIAKGVVEAHRGTLGAQSDGPGLGSTFVVILPTLRSFGSSGDPNPGT